MPLLVEQRRLELLEFEKVFMRVMMRLQESRLL